MIKIYQKYCLEYILLFAILFSACRNGPNDSGAIKINPYLKEIKLSNAKLSPNFYMAVWRENMIYPIQGFSKIMLDNQYNVLKDSLLEEDISWRNWSYIDANHTGTKLLLIENKNDIYNDIPTTNVFEYDVQSGQYHLLYDKTRNVATARYYPGSDTKIVYYSFGDSVYKSAGYYLHDKITQQDTLLFPYLSSEGIWETLHGFDIHPNSDTLLIPISQSIGRFEGKSPKLGIVSISLQKLDTLNIVFPQRDAGLFVRYNRTGTKILYTYFPRNAYGSVTNGTSEVGIIDASTYTKKILDVNTNTESLYGSVQIASNWSPDEKAIVFGSGQVTSSGQAGRRHLYILTLIE